MSWSLRRSIAAVVVMVVGAAAWWLGSDARADDPAPAPRHAALDDDDGADPAAPVPVGGRVLIAPGASYQYLAITAPPVVRQLGPVALAGVDRALGRRPDGASVLGELPAGLPPATWPLSLGGAAGHAPFAAAVHGEDCACTTRLPDVDTRRVAALYATTTFTASAADRELRMLELRVRYHDGLVAWLNGTEIARRALPADAPALALAERPHGPEWETFHVPIARGFLRPGANVLSLLVQPSGRNPAPALDAELVGFTAPRVIRGPMVQRVGRDRATIVVETDLPVPAAIEWGTSDALGHRVASPPATRHQIELTGLPPSAAIHYRVVAAGIGPIASFHTAPGPGDAVRVAVYGDVRGGHATHAALIDAMLDEAPDLVVATGDLVLRGTDEADWQRFFTVTAGMLAQVAYYPAIGNHDTGKTGDQQRRFGDLFAPPPGPADRPDWAQWYAFDVGDLHLVMLDSNGYDSAAQLAWLRRDLADARGRGVRAIIAATHDGPYSRGIHQGNLVAQRDYVPVLAGAKVALLLSGHDHMYQRGRAGGVDYVVSGGGGAPLYPITCGVTGKPRCKVSDGMLAVMREHHYVMVTLHGDDLEVCPRRADRTALEPCVHLALPR